MPTENKAPCAKRGQEPERRYRLIIIGAVTGVFGIKGELKGKLLVGDERLFKKAKSVALVDKAGKVFQKDIVSVRFHKDSWLVKLSGVDDPDAGLLLKGHTFQVEDSALPPAGADEVYWKDIEGAKVIYTSGSPVGTLADYIETGPTDAFEIVGEDGVSYLISNNPSHVLKIDPETKTVTVDRDGLVEN